MTQNAPCVNINGEARIDLAQPNSQTARSLTQTRKGNGQAGVGGGYIEFRFEHVDFEMFILLLQFSNRASKFLNQEDIKDNVLSLLSAKKIKMFMLIFKNSDI